jgi:hypothetical protein
MSNRLRALAVAVGCPISVEMCGTDMALVG